MAVDEQAEIAAKDELKAIQTEWKKITSTIGDFQITSKEDKYYRDRLWQVKDGFTHSFGNFVSIEFYRESLGIFESIHTDLELALRKGKENYEREKHHRRIDWAKAIGIGAIILIAIYLVIKFVWNIEILLP